jgi:hypothetical protein
MLCCYTPPINSCLKWPVGGTIREGYWRSDSAQYGTVTLMQLLARLLQRRQFSVTEGSDCCVTGCGLFLGTRFADKKSAPQLCTSLLVDAYSEVTDKMYAELRAVFRGTLEWMAHDFAKVPRSAALSVFLDTVVAHPLSATSATGAPEQSDVEATAALVMQHAKSLFYQSNGMMLLLLVSGLFCIDT